MHTIVGTGGAVGDALRRELVPAALGVEPEYQVLRPLLVSLAGLMNADIRELREMLYQNRYPYLFDSSRFEEAFGFEPTSYVDGIGETSAAYRTAP